jgi:hypothetical protein
MFMSIPACQYKKHVFFLFQMKKGLEEEDKERRKYFLLIQGMRRRWKLERPSQLMAMVVSFFRDLLKLKVNFAMYKGTVS